MKNWYTRIEETENAMDLLSVAREYLGEWEPSELALLPAQARPQRIKGADDLAYWHQKLVDCYCTEMALRQVELEKVRDMLHFFAFATQRALELDGAAPASEHEAVAQLFSERSVPRLFTSAMTGAGEH
jgi:hypothetical protein